MSLTRTLAVVAVVTLAASVGAAAATLGTGSNTLQSGSDPVPRCDTSFTFAFNASTSDATKVASVTVGDIAAACAGGQLSVTITDSLGAEVGTGGPATAGAPTTTVILSPQPQFTQVKNAYAAIAGPEAP